MPVVVNEFEALPESPAGAKEGAKADVQPPPAPPPAPRPAERSAQERAARWCGARAARVRAC